MVVIGDFFKFARQIKLTMKKTLLFLLLGQPLLTTAQNPIIRDQFTADPTARVFNNKVYLYPSHDIVPPEGQRQDWFCMEDYHVFSSENLTEWTDHGVIVTQNNVPWVKPDSYAMWAPDCIERNGKYYFYFPAAPKSGMGFGVGVAIADSPTGPFVPESEPIKGINGIDPCVLQASDGNAYIFWGAGRCAKLKPNMKELADDTPTEKVKWGNREFEMKGVNCLKDLPNRQAEGPFAFEYNGNYYLTYPYVRENTEVLGYAMSKHPMGPYEYKGLIMAEHPNSCWTNHHSIVNYKGQWYLFYHTNFFSPRDDKRRSVCIEKLFFNADGTIQEVKETMRGVGINQATEKIEIDRFSDGSVGVTTNDMDFDSIPRFRGACVNLPQKGSWVKYNDVDFSSLYDGYLVISAKAGDNTTFYVREKSATGKILAKIEMTVKPETPAGMPAMFRRDFSNQWLTQTAPLAYTPKGVTDLVITCEGDAPVSIDWLQFKNRPKYFSSVTTATATPDANGYIHRWMLLEPIRQNVRSNVIFTNTWLEKAFAKTYFKDQLTMLPRDGQKVKAVADKAQGQANFRPMDPAQVEEKPQTKPQTVAWHALDSEDYNVKLFRFAEKWGQQTYGSLFWAVTVIDCPEEMPNVRLAAGSNGASKWWLNGEEVLLLEGDRRMVEDDGMSARLTLRKGRNILRCAVINGPGLSDLCARFLDENNNPITNYSIKLQ